MRIIKDILRKTNGWPIRSLYAGQGTILALHRVIPASPGFRIRNNGLEITPEKLEQLILYFKRKSYDCLSIDELSDRLKSNAKNKFVIFTFDDGYHDNHDVAYPLLKSYDIPFTIYLTYNYILRKKAIWWYLIEDLLKAKKAIQFIFRGEKYQYNTESKLKKEAAFSNLRKLFIEQDGSGLEELMHVLFDDGAVVSTGSEMCDMLSIESIKKLHDDKLVTVGAHTFNHLALNKLNKNEFLHEVEDSRLAIEKMIGGKVHHFSYPFGSQQEAGAREFNWIKELDFETAVTGRPGNIHKAHLNHLTALPRLYISQNTTEDDISKFVSGTTPCLTGLRKRAVTE